VGLRALRVASVFTIFGVRAVKDVIHDDVAINVWQVNVAGYVSEVRAIGRLSYVGRVS
jgi:hypothetical protein